MTLVAAALAALAGGLLGRRAGWPLAAVGIVFYTVLKRSTSIHSAVAT